jgi:hypothetical protein
MNESTHRVRGDQSQRPHDQKNHKNSPKHVRLLSIGSPPYGISYPSNVSRRSSFFFNLVFDFRRGCNRASTMTHESLALFDDSFGSVPKLIGLFIQVPETCLVNQGLLSHVSS